MGKEQHYIDKIKELEDRIKRLEDYCFGTFKVDQTFGKVVATIYDHVTNEKVAEMACKDN